MPRTFVLRGEGALFDPHGNDLTIAKFDEIVITQIWDGKVKTLQMQGAQILKMRRTYGYAAMIYPVESCKAEPQSGIQPGKDAAQRSRWTFYEAIKFYNTRSSNETRVFPYFRFSDI